MVSVSKFHFLEAFDYGPPPEGSPAECHSVQIGVDKLCLQRRNARVESLRDQWTFVDHGLVGKKVLAKGH